MDRVDELVARFINGDRATVRDQIREQPQPRQAIALALRVAERLHNPEDMSTYHSFMRFMTDDVELPPPLYSEED